MFTSIFYDKTFFCDMLKNLNPYDLWRDHTEPYVLLCDNPFSSVQYKYNRLNGLTSVIFYGLTCDAIIWKYFPYYWLFVRTGCQCFRITGPLWGKSTRYLSVSAPPLPPPTNLTASKARLCCLFSLLLTWTSWLSNSWVFPRFEVALAWISCDRRESICHRYLFPCKKGQ